MVQVFERTGNNRMSVIVDYWHVLPPIIYFALGLLGPPSFFRGCEPVEHSSADGLLTVTLSCSSGTSHRITYTEDGIPALKAVITLKSAGPAGRRVSFEGQLP